MTVSSLDFPAATAVALFASILLVSRLERLAARWHLTDAMLGLLVALAADGPEITSSITASAHGERSIGAGVVLGSNVFNLAALLGLSAVVARRIDFHRRVVALEGVVAVWVALVAFLIVAVRVPAWAGLVMVVVAVVPYLVASAIPPGRLDALGLPTPAARWLRRALTEEGAELAVAVAPTHPTGRRDGPLAALSALVVVGASWEMERSAESIGRAHHLTTLVVGGIVLAAVTSLPNAVGGVYLAARGRGAALLSEAMNSNMINVVAGLILPGLFLGVGAAGAGGLLVASWYLVMCGAVLLVAFAARGVSRTWGAATVAAYVAFVLVAIARPG